MPKIDAYCHKCWNRAISLKPPLDLDDSCFSCRGTGLATLPFCEFYTQKQLDKELLESIREMSKDLRKQIIETT